jgi:hypothetical protein
VEVIPHGVPVIPRGPKDSYRSRAFFGADKKVIFTNGLIHQGKGLEIAIRVRSCVDMLTILFHTSIHYMCYGYAVFLF